MIPLSDALTLCETAERAVAPRAIDAEVGALKEEDDLREEEEDGLGAEVAMSVKSGGTKFRSSQEPDAPWTGVISLRGRYDVKRTPVGSYSPKG